MVGPCRQHDSSSRVEPFMQAEEDRELTQEEMREFMVNGDRDMPTLDPAGLWFDDDPVKKAAREAYTTGMTTFYSTWKKASDEQKEHWWNMFKSKFMYKKTHEQVVRDEFERWGLMRMSDIVYRAGKGDDKWMTAEVKKGFGEWRESDKYKIASAQKKKNRLAASEEGKATGTHAMGRVSVTQYTDRLAAEEFQGQVPPVGELVKKAKTTKKGNFVSLKAKAIYDKFARKKKVHQMTHPDASIDENQMYYVSAGGHDKKGRVYGTGKATSYYFDRYARHSSTGERSTYAPGLFVQMTQAHLQTQSELEAMRARVAALEESMAESHALNTQSPPTCHLDDLILHEHKRFDDGDSGSSTPIFGL